MKKYITPEFVSGFTAISKPYENEFIIRGRFEGAAKDAILETLKQAVAEDGRSNVTPSGIKKEMDGDKETGAILVTFKCKAGGLRKRDGKEWSRTIQVVDSKNQPVTEEVSKGSKVRVGFTTYGTEFKGTNYLRLQPQAVQVIELVTFEAGGGSFFDEVDGGFETSGATQEVPKADAPATGGSDAWDF